MRARERAQTFAFLHRRAACALSVDSPRRLNAQLPTDSSAGTATSCLVVRACLGHSAALVVRPCIGMRFVSQNFCGHAATVCAVRQRAACCNIHSNSTLHHHEFCHCRTVLLYTTYTGSPWLHASIWSAIDSQQRKELLQFMRNI